jgi:hypothetical protein
MKKWLFLLVALLGFSSLAGAQKLSIGGGLSLAAGTGIDTSIGGNVYLNIGDLYRFGPIGLDARVGITANITGATGTVVDGTVAALGTFGLLNVTVYAGPQALIPITPAGRALNFGALAGARLGLAQGVSFTAEVNALFNPFTWKLSMGVAYSLF